MADGIRVAPGLTLDPDYVGGGTFALLAKKGAGKTYLGRVLAEEFWRAKVPFVALDPMGAMWGLRSNADGTGRGLPVPIFGGDHGDVPLERGSGEILADLVVDERLSMIIDMKRLGSRAAEREFARTFLDRLYRRNSELVHLLVDEADLFAPQKPAAGDQPLLGVTENIVRRGRNVGIGITLISQRPAVLNKDVLTQVDGLIAMRITGFQDREAIDDWVRGHADQEAAREVKATLAGLANGECWWWVPELNILKRVQTRLARTFDSSPTRRRGDRASEPKTLADVDMAAISERMAATIERAKADDPRELRRQIADLQAQLRHSPAAEADAGWQWKARAQELGAALREAQARPAEQIEVPVLAPGDVAALEQAIAAARDLAGGLELALGRATVPAPKPAPAPVPTKPPAPLELRAATPTVVAPGDSRIGKRERAILAALAKFPDGRTHRQIALLTGYSPKASTIGAGLSALRKHGYVSPGGNPVVITGAGIEALGDDYEPLPSGRALLDYWNGQLGARERALLAVLLARSPGTLTQREMAEATGYSPEASTIGAGMSRLRGLGLADGWSAAAEFVEAIRDEVTA